MQRLIQICERILSDWSVTTIAAWCTDHGSRCLQKSGFSHEVTESDWAIQRRTFRDTIDYGDSLTFMVRKRSSSAVAFDQIQRTVPLKEPAKKRQWGPREGDDAPYVAYNAAGQRVSALSTVDFVTEPVFCGIALLPLD